MNIKQYFNESKSYFKECYISLSENHPVIKILITEVIIYFILKLIEKGLYFISSTPRFLYLFIENNPSIDFTELDIAEPVFTEMLYPTITLILFILISVIFITYSIGCIKTRVKLAALNHTFNHETESPLSQLQNDFSLLEEKNNALQSSLDEYNEWEALMSGIAQYVNNSEVVHSILLYDYSPLKRVEELSTNNSVDIYFHFKDGYAKRDLNINALFNVNYQFDYDIYCTLVKLFARKTQYYKNFSGKQKDSNEELGIQNDALNAFDKIKDLLNSEIKTPSDIKDIHYAYYRMLEVLANVVIATPVVSEAFLSNAEIEQQLKSGQRTGMLGALFTETTYVFFNTRSLTKGNRVYFSTPLSYKKKRLILLAVLEKDKLRFEPDDTSGIRCYERIFDQIRDVICKSAISSEV